MGKNRQSKSCRLFDRWMRDAHRLARISNGLANDAVDRIRANIAPERQTIRQHWGEAGDQARKIYAMRYIGSLTNGVKVARENLQKQLSELSAKWFGVQARAVLRFIPFRKLAAIKRRAMKQEAESVATTLRLSASDVVSDILAVGAGRFSLNYDASKVLALFDRIAEYDVDLAIKVMADAIDNAWLLDELEIKLAAIEARLERGINTAVDTATQAMSGDTEEYLLELLGDAVEYVMYAAIMDSRTCLQCGYYARPPAIWKVSDPKRPMIPIHPNCRCAYIPLPAGYAPPEEEAYADWFRRQSWKEKRRILGPTRYRLYRKGVKIDRFVNNRGDIIRVEKLPRGDKIPDAWKKPRPKRK